MFWKRDVIEIHWSCGAARLEIVIKARPERTMALFCEAIRVVAKKLGIDENTVVCASDEDDDSGPTIEPEET